jgi:hypothetical protein
MELYFLAILATKAAIGFVKGVVEFLLRNSQRG